MDGKVIWKGRMGFDGVADTGFHIPLDTSPEFGGDSQGLRPLELIALGLAGCTAMDVISILKKKRLEVTAFEVRVHAERADDHPRVFTQISLEYVVTGHGIDQASVERAVDLSAHRYCSASAMLEKAAPIEHKITIIEA